MSIPPIVVSTVRNGWNWQWNQLMNNLAPADKKGSYKRPISEHLKSLPPNEEDLQRRTKQELPVLIIGKSCPWAHRTWLTYKLLNLENSISLVIACADHKAGRWALDAPLMGRNSLVEVYKKCGSPPLHRATVPVLIDPGTSSSQPKILCNESALIIEMLNSWPIQKDTKDLAPKHLLNEIELWQSRLQKPVNDGVYRCGFARSQEAYEQASSELFSALQVTDKSLSKKGPWLCGEKLTLADIRLFPTLIRWEVVYAPLFKCSMKPLWTFKSLWEWRKRFFSFPEVSTTCCALTWKHDYYGALFPLNPSNIIPEGPELKTIVNSNAPLVK